MNQYCYFYQITSNGPDPPNEIVRKCEINKTHIDICYSIVRQKIVYEITGGSTLFAERLRMLRTEKGQRQEDIANVIGVTKAAISGYENGWRHPSDAILIKLAAYFQVSTDYLLGITDHRKTFIYNFTEEQLRTAKDVFTAVLHYMD